MGILEVRAEDSQANQQEWQDIFGGIKGRVDPAGTFMTSVNSEPDSATLAVGECAWWYDIANDRVRFKARKDSNTVLKGQVDLA